MLDNARFSLSSFFILMPWLRTLVLPAPQWRALLCRRGSRCGRFLWRRRRWNPRWRIDDVVVACGNLHRNRHCRRCVVGGSVSDKPDGVRMPIAELALDFFASFFQRCTVANFLDYITLATVRTGKSRKGNGVDMFGVVPSYSKRSDRCARSAWRVRISNSD
jgi:hypothetical protein